MTDIVLRQQKVIKELRGDISRSHTALMHFSGCKNYPVVFPSSPTYRHGTRRAIMKQHQEIQGLRDVLISVQRRLVQCDVRNRPVQFEDVFNEAQICVTEINFGFFEAEL